MLDLFGETVTVPQCSEKHMKNILNASHGFAEFWKTWPANESLCFPEYRRKVAKQQVLNKWARYECAREATLICQHVEWMKTQHDWTKDGGAFIPQPLTYLNQRRWDGWEPPVVRKQENVLEAIKAHKGAPIPQEVRDKIAALTRR